MRTLATPLLVTAALLGAGTDSAQAELYRWTDESGRTHFSDTPPPSSARDVEEKRVRGVSSGSPIEPYALQQARKNHPVTYYSTPECKACDEGRALLNSRGVPFREVSVTSPKEIEALQAAVGSNSVPALVVGSKVQKGFEPGAYQRLLDAAGYPKAGILPSRNQPAPPPPAQSEGYNAEEPASEAPTQPSGPYAPRFR